MKIWSVEQVVSATDAYRKPHLVKVGRVYGPGAVARGVSCTSCRFAKIVGYLSDGTKTAQDHLRKKHGAVHDAPPTREQDSAAASLQATPKPPLPTHGVLGSVAGAASHHAVPPPPPGDGGNGAASPPSYEQAAQLLSHGRPVEAAQLLEQVVQAEPWRVEARFDLALAWFRTGNLPEARRRFHEVVDADGGYHLGWYYLGVCLERLGESTNAVSAWRAALAVRPDFEPARTKLTQHGQILPPAPPSTPPPGTAHQPHVAVNDAVPTGMAGGAVVASQVVPTQMAQGHVAHGRPGTMAQLVDTAVKVGQPPERISPGVVLWQGPRRVLSCMTQTTVWTWLVALLTAVLGGLIFWSENEAVLTDQAPGELQFGSLVGVAILGMALDLPQYFVRSGTSHFTVYERRIDGREGVLSRKEFTVWMYEVSEISLTRSVWELLTGDATLTLTLGEGKGDIAAGAPKGEIKLRGLGNHRQMAWLRDFVRDRSLMERRAMKQSWI